MKKIGLIDVDSHNFPNLALMKISAYHKGKGDTVEWAIPLDTYNIVYQSKVFDETYSPEIMWEPQADEIIKGGTGYNLTNKLPDEIEHIYPDYGLYPKYKNTAYGFLTRGCPRHCDFCIVSEKEGCRSIKVAKLSEFWKGQKEIVLLDPNLLACKDRSELLSQLAESNAYVDFSQGLDIRMCDKEVIKQLAKIKTKRLHFAWDNPKDDLREKFKIFNENYHLKDPSRKIVYTLVNFNSTFEEDLWRIYELRALNFNPYVMIYNKPFADKKYKRLQRWCNNRIIFYACKKFEDYKE